MEDENWHSSADWKRDVFFDTGVQNTDLAEWSALGMLIPDAIQIIIRKEEARKREIVETSLTQPRLTRRRPLSSGSTL